MRQAGNAWHPMGGKVHATPSCQPCAKILHDAWLPDLFEGTCTGCGVALSGLVD